ncbi:MAG TPA: alpha/beta hydrolase [Phycisphaerae bacterium]|nr:alpha/beta hydrolase [Phycisphaerae bacterium]
MTLRWFLVSLWPLLAPCEVPATSSAALPAFTRTGDVIYGRKFGTALTLDVFTPTGQTNGAAVIWAVSGGWFSDHEHINAGLYAEFLERGYTVFAVVHGSQPKYTIPEVLEDMNRAVRFIRANAARFGIDRNRIGISGASAGGHLSLMVGLAGAPPKPNNKDPVMHEAGRVQAVACFFPPTDFLNYGESGRDVFRAMLEELKPFQAPFDFHEMDVEKKMFVPIADGPRRLDIARQISPIAHVSPDDPPTLIIHGDADKLVPIQQSEGLIEKLKAAGVTARLVSKPGAGHGWPDFRNDIALFADWFDAHLAKPAAAGLQSEQP